LRESGEIPMTTAIMNPAIQGGAATPRPATTQQAPATGTNEDLGTTIREAIRSSVQAQAAASQARAAAAAQRGQPTPSPEPTVVFRGSDGAQQTFTVPPFGFRDNVIPQQVVDISVAFFLTMAAIIIGLPLARAFARRMDRRGGAAQIPNEIASQLTQLNQAVDAIALEVERISEGQRYTTRLLSEQQSAKLPAGTQR
jgi:hypothetical protein